MKKKLSFLTLTVFILMSFYSCEKGENDSLVADSNQNNVNESIASKSKIRKSTLTWELDSSFYIDSTIAADMGYEDILIAPGTYTITYTSTNYGSVSLDIDSYNTTGDTTGSTDLVIYIGNRKQRCIRGIGFRCGIGRDEVPDDPNGVRSKDGEISVDVPNSTLDIQFTEYVDWNTLDD